MPYRNDFVNELARFYRKTVENLKDISFSENVRGISHRAVVPSASYSPWLDDPAFGRIYERLREHTLVDIYRCFELFSLIKQTRRLDGDILEVGVWRGGTGFLLASALKEFGSEGVVFLADTFSGVVKASRHDSIYKGGEHSDTSLEMVNALFTKAGLSNYQILKGIFPDQVDLPDHVSKLKLCHIDVDTYQSAYDVFARVWPIVVPGGIVVFDDYGFWGCEGITKLCNELMETLDHSTFVHNLNGHGIFIKK